jgi:hypothetical protein
MFTARQKLECIEREIKYREWVYPRRVAEGKMTQGQADKQLGLMEEIAEDYRDQVEVDEPELSLGD